MSCGIRAEAESSSAASAREPEVNNDENLAARSAPFSACRSSRSFEQPALKELVSSESNQSRNPRDEAQLPRSLLGPVKSLDSSGESAAAGRSDNQSMSSASSHNKQSEQRRASVTPASKNASDCPQSTASKFSLRHLAVGKKRASLQPSSYSITASTATSGQFPFKLRVGRQARELPSDEDDQCRNCGESSVSSTETSSDDLSDSSDSYFSDEQEAEAEPEGEGEEAAAEGLEEKKGTGVADERVQEGGAGRMIGVKKKKKRRSHRKSATLTAAQKRRGSLCACEPIVNGIDFEGQPVTDVDLVTYKHLCQLEQRQQQMRANLRRRPAEFCPREQERLDGAGELQRRRPGSETPAVGALSASCRYAQTLALVSLTSPRAGSRSSGQLKRRSSLQEESGAYYQLCTSAEEQAIRAKYIWFPPALKTLALVDQFFAYFPKDKIPYAPMKTLCASDEPPNVAPTQADCKPSGGANNTGQHPVNSLASSYRDEQISFQLPRQDISLDYCSYPMDEQTRASYLQFVDKRDSQALDVGSVVQVSLALGGAVPMAPSLAAASHRQRKQSSASQIVMSEGQNFAGPPASQLTSASPQKSAPVTQQRCRRCLVRFEEGQLAVVAPNFSIGTGGIYGHAHHHHHQNKRELMKVAPTTSLRRASVGLQQAAGTDAADSTAPVKTAGPHTSFAKQNSAMFHPQCFICATCKEFLVDLVYCLRDNKLFCLRHYGESVRPRCHWCQEVSICAGAR